MASRNDGEHPDRERTALTYGEQRRWAQFIAKEIRHDVNATRARVIIAGTLDACEGTGWCGCSDHVNALAMVVKCLWIDQP
jgi:hypothetical protein